MATYGQNTLHLSSSLSLAGEFVNNGTGFFAVLIGGAISDMRGRKYVMIVPQILFCVAIVPCFLWLTVARDASSFLISNVILSALSNFMYGAVYAAISESIPKEVRARAFALVYSIPVAVFGGTTQLVVTWLLQVTRNPMSIAWYLTGISVIGLGAMIALRESAPRILAERNLPGQLAAA